MRGGFVMRLFYFSIFSIWFSLSSFLACAQISSGGSWRDNIFCRQAGFVSCDQLDVFYTFKVSDAKGRGNSTSSMDVSDGAEHLVFNYVGEDFVNLLETTFNFTIKQNDQSLPKVGVVGVSINAPEKTITLDLGTALFDGEGKEILQLNNREGYKWEPSELEITNLADSRCRRDGFAGGFSVTDKDSPCLIENQEQLQKINDNDNNLAGHYKLINSIDFQPSSSPIVPFTPIGTAAVPFTGSIDGNGHTFQNLEISMPTESDIGFIRACATCRIEKLGMIDVEIEGQNDVGGFVGNSRSLILSQTYLIGTIQGVNDVGGLVGRFEGGTIQDTYTVGNVSTSSSMRGIAGGLIGLYRGGTVRNSYSITDVSGSSGATELGGVVGGYASIQQPDLSSVYLWWKSRVFGVGTDDLNSNNIVDVGENNSSRNLFRNTLLKCPIAPTTEAVDCGAVDDQRLLYTAWDTEIWNFGDDSSYPVLRLKGEGFPAGNDTPVVRTVDSHELLQSHYIAFFATRPNFGPDDSCTNTTRDFNIPVSRDDCTNITRDFNVPVSVNGFSIIWSSSDTSILNIDSLDTNTGNVTVRNVTVTPQTADIDVTLTATLARGEGASTVSFTKTFNLTVKAP